MTDQTTTLEPEDSTASNSTRLLSAGQVKPGDFVYATFKNERTRHEVDEVLNAGTGSEEVILEARKNLYFITSMVLDGTSWAKDVVIESR